MMADLQSGFRPQKKGVIGSWSSCGRCLKVTCFLYDKCAFLTAKYTEFADPPPPAAISPAAAESSNTGIVDKVVPEEEAPTTLMQWAVLILNTANPTLKVCSCQHRNEVRPNLCNLIDNL
jgi:hypothetical protein